VLPTGEKEEESPMLEKVSSPIENIPDAKTEPVDKFKIIYGIMLLNGIGFLLPWNVFINADKYFTDYKLNTTVSENTEYRLQFLNYVGFAAQFPNLIFSGLNAFYQPSGHQSKSRLPTTRILVTILLEILTLIISLILACINSYSWPFEFFVITIILVVIVNAASAVYTSVGYGLAAYLPMTYSNAVVIGTNVCGTLIAILNIVTKASAGVTSGHQLRDAAIGYFGVTVFIMLLCLGSYFYLKNSNYFLYHMERSLSNISQDCKSEKEAIGLNINQQNSHVETGTEAIKNGIHNSNAHNASEVVLELVNEHATEKTNTAHHLVPAGIEVQPEANHLLGSADHKNVPYEDESVGGFKNCFAICCVSPAPEAHRRCSQYWSKYKIAFQKCWVHYLSVWSTLFCTLAVFPAVLADIKPSSPSFFISAEWYSDVTCFLFFNLFAMIGNICASFVQFPGPRFLFIPVWIRTLFFIPFFLLSNFRPGETLVTPVFNNDYVYLLGILVFSFTSGYFSSLSILYSRNSVVGSLKNIATMLAVFSLSLGLFCGAYGSYFFIKCVMGFL
jgi:hypothetical protein